MPGEFLRQYELFLRKAHADLRSAEILFKADDSEVDVSIVLFHLQQAAEKYLKALISHHGTHFEKIHDLRRLLDLCRECGITLPAYAEDFVELNPFAVEGRYALLHDDMADAERFLMLVNEFGEFAVSALHQNR
jgi:HEPN domain-containing protein